MAAWSTQGERKQINHTRLLKQQLSEELSIWIREHRSNGFLR